MMYLSIYLISIYLSMIDYLSIYCTLMYVCVYVCMYECMYVCVSIYLSISSHVNYRTHWLAVASYIFRLCGRRRSGLGMRLAYHLWHSLVSEWVEQDPKILQIEKHHGMKAPSLVKLPPSWKRIRKEFFKDSCMYLTLYTVKW